MSDDSVKFRIGFEDSPEAYQQLENLASAVEATQSRISDMMAEIGASAAQAAKVAASAGEAAQIGGGSGPVGQSDPSGNAMLWVEDWQDARAKDLQNAQQHMTSLGQLASSEVATIENVTNEFEAMWNQVNANIDDVRDNAGSIDASLRISGMDQLEGLVEEVDAWQNQLRDPMVISVEADADLQIQNAQAIDQLAKDAEELQYELESVDASKAISQVSQLNRELEEAASEADEVSRLLESAGLGTFAEDAAVDGQKKVEEAANNARKAMDEEAERQKKFADEMLAVNDKLEESWINAARSIGGAVRGIAMLSASQSEDVQAAIEMLLQVQGAVDAAINSADAIKNVTRAMRDYSAARDLAIQGATAAGTQAATRAAGSAASGVASGAASGAAGGAATAGGMAIGGGAAALGSAIAAAIGGSLFAIFSGFKTGQSALQSGIGGGAQEGSFVDTVGGSDWNPFSWMFAADKKWERDYKEAITERMQSERELLLRQKELNAQKLANQMEIMQLEQSTEMRRLAARESFELAVDNSPERRLDMMDQREAVIGRQIEETQDVMSQAESSGNYALAEQAQQRIVEMEQERQSMLTERLTLERQIADEQVRGAEEAIRSLEQQLDMRDQEKRAIEESLMTAKERFAALSETEQQEAISVAETIRSGNAQSLTDEQRNLARRIGTEELNAGAREADLAEADNLGFDRFFGGAERQSLAENARQQEQIKAEINVNQEIIAKVEIDLGTLEAQLQQEFANAERRLRQLAEQARAAAIEAQGREMSQQGANSSNVG